MPEVGELESWEWKSVSLSDVLLGFEHGESLEGDLTTGDLLDELGDSAHDGSALGSVIHSSFVEHDGFGVLVDGLGPVGFSREDVVALVGTSEVASAEVGEREIPEAEVVQLLVLLLTLDGVTVVLDSLLWESLSSI